MRLSDVMSTPVVTVEGETTVTEAQTLMRTKGIHHLAVRGDGKRLGVVSTQDFIGAGPNDRVRDVMSAPVVSATRRTTVRQAANLMRGNAVGCLLVMERDKAVGIITVADLLALVGRGVERPVAKGQRWILRDRGPRKRRVGG